MEERRERTLASVRIVRVGMVLIVLGQWYMMVRMGKGAKASASETCNWYNARYVNEGPCSGSRRLVGDRS